MAGGRTRILRVIARMNLGGPAHQVSLLSGRRLDPERYETLLVHGAVAAGEESMADLAEREGAQTRYVASLRQPVDPWADTRALMELTRICRGFRPDIVHTHTAKAGFVGRTAALALRPRPKIVHTFHGHVLRGYFGTAKTRTFLELERRLARVSDRLVGVSEQTVAELVELGVAERERFQVIPLGLDLDPFLAVEGTGRAAAREQLGLPASDVVLCFVGRFAPIKRIDVLLDALAVARADGAQVHLALVGDGEARSELEGQAARLGLAGAVSFLGYRRDLPLVYAAADAAVLSSDNEGTPVSLIEAAAAALPAVATDVGGVASVVTPQGGLLVPAGDPRALGEAIAAMASADGKARRDGPGCARARSRPLQRRPAGGRHRLALSRVARVSRRLRLYWSFLLRRRTLVSLRRELPLVEPPLEPVSWAGSPYP